MAGHVRNTGRAAASYAIKLLQVHYTQEEFRVAVDRWGPIAVASIVSMRLPSTVSKNNRGAH